MLNSSAGHNPILTEMFRHNLCAQIKTALTQAGIAPPELDGWTWDRQKSEQGR